MCQCRIAILLFLSTLVVFSIIFTTLGVSFTDALFEVGSWLTTNGISLGYTVVTMPIGYKWLLIAVMTIWTNRDTVHSNRGLFAEEEATFKILLSN